MSVSFAREMHEIAGCRVSLRRGGSGPALLHLHDAGGAAVVPPFLEELAAHYEVLLPEHPGFGASDVPDWLDDIHDLAYFYLELLEALDLRDVTLIGASLGGWLALEIAVRNATRLRAMTLLAPAGIHVAGLPKGDLFLWDGEDRVRNLFHDQRIADGILNTPATPADIDALARNTYTFTRLAWEPRLYDRDLHKWLCRIRVPVQFVWGDRDKVLPVGYAAEFGRRIAGSRVDVIRDCGHLPHIEQPQQFLRLFGEFTAGLPGRPGEPS
jgi:pimeloyl-ACP methyl ester carboxylesterase